MGGLVLNNSNDNLSLEEIAHRYLSSLTPEEQEASQQEINRFVSWFGPPRPLTELTAPELGGYAESIAISGSDSARKLEPVKALLLFAKKEGFTKHNLATHLRASTQVSKKKTSGKGHRRRETTLTAQGYEEKKQELEDLKKERPKIQDDIQKARADKDVRENAPLDAAREHQSHVESRIRDLEKMLESAQIIDGNGLKAITVAAGNTVTIQDMETGKVFDCALVDPQEVNPAQGKISFVSPVGKALLGKTVGEVIEVNVPDGLIHYKIEKITN